MWITDAKRHPEPRQGGAGSRGFTLIELLIAIAIIGILATVASVSLMQARRRARDTKRVADIQQIRNALLIYSNTRATYPVAVGEGGVELGGPDARCLDDSDQGFKAGGCAGLVIMERVPRESFGDSEYQYMSSAGSGTYALSFILEGAVGDLPGGNCAATPGSITCISP